MTKEEKKSYNKAYREANKDKEKAYNKAYREDNREKREANKEKKKAYNKAYREDNREKVNAKSKAYYEANKEKKKAYKEDNREKVNAYYKAYYEANKEKVKAYKEDNREKVNAYCKAYKKQRRDTDPLFKMKLNLGNRTYQAFKGGGYKKYSKTAETLGASYQEAFDHLEKRFTEGMEWSKHGKWHIDHIVPLSSAKTKEELIYLCNYTNLQPLWARDNLVKGAKLDWKSA